MKITYSEELLKRAEEGWPNAACDIGFLYEMG